MKWKLCLAGILLGATASLGAGGVRLRYKLSDGQVLRYHETIDGAGEFVPPDGGEPVRLRLEGSVQREWRVQRAKRRPRFGIDSQVAEAKLRGMRGTEVEEAAYPAARLWLEMTETGKIGQVRPHPPDSPPPEPLNLLGLPLDLNALFHGLLTVELPEEPVEKGATWLEEEMPLPLGNGSEEKARIHIRLQDLQPYRGQDCAEIDAGFEAPLEVLTQWEGTPVVVKGRVREAMLLHFALERGLVIHAEGTLELEWTLTEADAGGPSPPPAASVKMTLKLETNLEESPWRGRKSNEENKGSKP